MAVSFSRMSLSLAGGVGELRYSETFLEGRLNSSEAVMINAESGVEECRLPVDSIGKDNSFSFLCEISSRHRQSFVGNEGRHRFLKCSQGRGIRNVR